MLAVLVALSFYGYKHWPGSSLSAADASALYARNLLNFLNLLCDPKNGGKMNINREDDIIAGSLLCMNGEVATK